MLCPYFIPSCTQYEGVLNSRTPRIEILMLMELGSCYVNANAGTPGRLERSPMNEPISADNDPLPPIQSVSCYVRKREYEVMCRRVALCS